MPRCSPDGLHLPAASVVVAAVLVGAISSGAAQEESPTCSRPPIMLNRHEEDYAFLSEPQCRTEIWDSLKYMSLADDASMHLSVGADLRERFEYVHNRDWGRGGDDAYLLHRIMVHGDAHLGALARGFVQLTSNVAIDRAGGPGPVDEDQLDVHQAFVDARLDVPRAGSLTVRAGRQEIDYESARLITTREGANVRLSFDALRLMQRAGDWQVDAFVSAPVETDPGVFDDGRVPGQLLWGVYAFGPLTTGALALDLFYFGFKRRDATFDQGSAPEARHSIGVRASGMPVSLDYNVELVYQVGSFGADAINAWMIASDTGYTLSSVALKPRFGVQVNATSGDRDPGHPDLQTFNPLFPQASYFTDANLIGPLNHVDVHPAVMLHPSDQLSITLHYDAFWRESLADGVYRTSGALIASGQTNPARHIGSEVALRAQWRPDRHSTFVASYSHFLAGPFLRGAGLGSDVDFFAFWISYRI